MRTKILTEFYLGYARNNAHSAKNKLSLRAHDRILPVCRADFFGTYYPTPDAVPPVVWIQQVRLVFAFGVCRKYSGRLK